MEKLNLMQSIAESMEGGMLPHVPEELSLQQSVFPPKLHPRNASLEWELHAWASNLGPRYAAEVQHTIQISPLACYFWPCTIDEPPRRMLTLLKLAYWLFLVEHEVDDGAPAISDEEKVLQADKAVCKGVLEALVGAISESGAAPVVAPQLVIAVALEWWAEMREDGMTSLKQQARFVAEVTKYLQSQKLEQALLMTSSGPAPSLEVYTLLRRDTGAAGLICMAAEYGLGIELDEEAVSSALVLQLQDAATDHLLWVNDIYSFPKEFAKGECLNLVYLLHARNNRAAGDAVQVPFHVAVSQAWQMVKARQLDCSRLAEQIALSPHLASKPGLLRYVEALCLLTAGNWAWTLQVPRYNSPSERPNAPLSSFKHRTVPTALIMNNMRPARSTQPARLVMPTFHMHGNGLLASRLPPRTVLPARSVLSSITCPLSFV